MIFKAIYMVEGEPFEVQELSYREDEEEGRLREEGRGRYLPTHQRQRACGISQSLHRQETRASWPSYFIAERCGLQEVERERGAAKSSCPSRRCRRRRRGLPWRPLLAEISSHATSCGWLRALNAALILAPSSSCAINPR